MGTVKVFAYILKPVMLTSSNLETMIFESKNSIRNEETPFLKYICKEV